MKTYNVGLLGCGDISDIYFQTCDKFEIIRIQACASRDVEKAKRKAAAYHIPKACTIDELIHDPEIDIILNLTIPEVHAKFTLAALEAGKHVYSEKPLAANLDDAQEIMNLAKEKGLRVGCAPDTFLGARLQTCREVLEQGIIGDPIGASAFIIYPGPEWFHPNPDFLFQEGGGPLLDIGPYYITALISLFGPITSCCGLTRMTYAERTVPADGRKIKVEVPTHVTANLQFQNDAIATVVTSFDVSDSELPRIEIYGTKGTLLIQDVDPFDGPNIFGGQLYIRTKDQSRWLSYPRSEKSVDTDWDKVPITHGYYENYRGLGMADMAYAIRDNRPERASSEMAYHSLETMLGILHSSSKGEFYTLESTCEKPSPLPDNFPLSEGNDSYCQR